jgi:DNA-binding PadR family transcriptional regulator
MPIDLTNKSPSIRILGLLKDAKVPVSFYIIRKHISIKYSNEQIAKALNRLVRTGLISRSGKHKNNFYLISNKGLDHLFILERKIVAKNASNFVFEYLLRIGIGVD